MQHACSVLGVTSRASIATRAARSASSLHTHVVPIRVRCDCAALHPAAARARPRQDPHSPASCLCASAGYVLWAAGQTAAVLQDCRAGGLLLHGQPGSDAGPIAGRSGPRSALAHAAGKAVPQNHRMRHRGGLQAHVALQPRWPRLTSLLGACVPPCRLCFKLQSRRSRSAGQS